MGDRERAQHALFATGSLCIGSGFLFDVGWPFTAIAVAITSILSLFVTLEAWDQFR